MYSLETVESLHAYAGRLSREVARTRTAPRGRTSVRAVLRRVRRSG